MTKVSVKKAREEWGEHLVVASLGAVEMNAKADEWLVVYGATHGVRVNNRFGYWTRSVSSKARFWSKWLATRWVRISQLLSTSRRPIDGFLQCVPNGACLRAGRTVQQEPYQKTTMCCT